MNRDKRYFDNNYDYKLLAEITTLSSGVADIVFTSTKKTHVTLILLHNTEQTSQTVALHKVPDYNGEVGTTASSNRIYYENVPPNDTVFIEFPEPGLILKDVNDTIQGYAESSSGINIEITGGHR